MPTTAHSSRAPSRGRRVRLLCLRGYGHVEVESVPPERYGPPVPVNPKTAAHGGRQVNPA